MMPIVPSLTCPAARPPLCLCARSMVGLTSGMDTLCGQVYGAGLHAAVGVVFQRAVLMCLVLGAPCYLVWWQAERVLLLLGEAGRGGAGRGGATQQDAALAGPAVTRALLPCHMPFGGCLPPAANVGFGCMHAEQALVASPPESAAGQWDPPRLGIGLALVQSPGAHACDAVLALAPPTCLCHPSALQPAARTGQPHAASLLAARYVQRVSSALALTTIKLCCRSYFSAPGVMLPVSVITFICTMTAPLINYLFITV